MRTTVKIGAASVVALLVSGCGLFTGHQSARSDVNRETEMAAQEAIADINLDVGRENLREGNLAAAARYLTQARNHPATRAQASNALGVVYVRLGRLDVAERYFQDAVEADPANARYMTNLARLERDVSFAALRAGQSVDDRPAMASVEPVVPAAAEAELAPPQKASSRVEVSAPGVIHINTADVGQRAPQIQVVERRQVVQEIAQLEEGDAGTSEESAASQVKVVSYPIRIEM